MDCSVVISMDTSSYDVNSTWNFTGWSFYKTQHIILDFLHIKGTYELISKEKVQIRGFENSSHNWLQEVEKVAVITTGA